MESIRISVLENTSRMFAILVDKKKVFCCSRDDWLGIVLCLLWYNLQFFLQLTIFIAFSRHTLLWSQQLRKHFILS